MILPRAITLAEVLDVTVKGLENGRFRLTWS
jgi:hypothetical protein